MAKVEISSEHVCSGSLILKQARRIIDAMVEYASTKPGRPMAFAIVDAAGVLVYFVRMDGATPINRRMAENKAYTAIMFRRDTRATRDLLTNAGQKVADFGEPDRLTLIPGGNLIRLKDGCIVGAVGSSGRSEDEDEEVTLVGVRAYK